MIYSLSAKATAAALVVALCFGAGWRYGLKWKQAQWDAERVQQQEAHIEAQRLATIATGRVADAYAKNLARASANRLAAVSELDSLRDALNAATARADHPACRADGERVELLSRLLDEGADLAEEGRAGVERLAAKVGALQELAAGVCLK